MDRHSDPQYRDEEGSSLRIWRDAAPNNFLSEREGRPVYDEVIYVEVIAPGSGNSTPIFEAVRFLAKEANRAEPKYAGNYARFKKYVEDFQKDEKSDASLSGTPLSQWAEMSRTLVAELKAAKIFTVDALAALPDVRLTSVGPDGRTWREKARAYLELSKGSAHATALAADLEREKLKNADMAAQVATLAAQVATLQAASGSTAPAAPAVEPVAAPAPAPAASVVEPVAAAAPATVLAPII